jgi:multidrug efflux system membrane fusion protein
VVIPSAAIQTGAQGPFLFVSKPNNTAEVRQIQVDFIQGNTAVIRQGLSAGDKVVTDGQDKIQGGTKLVPHPSTTTRVPGSGDEQGASSDADNGGAQGGGGGRGHGNHGKGGANGAAGLSGGSQTESGASAPGGGDSSGGQHHHHRPDSQQGQNP